MAFYNSKIFGYYCDTVDLELQRSIPNVYCYFVFALFLLCVFFIMKLNQINLETIFRKSFRKICKSSIPNTYVN